MPSRTDIEVPGDVLSPLPLRCQLAYRYERHIMTIERSEHRSTVKRRCVRITHPNDERQRRPPRTARADAPPAPSTPHALPVEEDQFDPPTPECRPVVQAKHAHSTNRSTPQENQNGTGPVAARFWTGLAPSISAYHRLRKTPWARAPAVKRRVVLSSSLAWVCCPITPAKLSAMTRRAPRARRFCGGYARLTKARPADGSPTSVAVQVTTPSPSGGRDGSLSWWTARPQCRRGPPPSHSRSRRTRRPRLGDEHSVASYDLSPQALAALRARVVGDG
jgi:hypothetical protein